jgi:O-methyltransferase
MTIHVRAAVFERVAPRRSDWSEQIMWLRSQRVQKFLGGGALERIAIGGVSALEMLGLGTHKDSGTLRLIRRVRRERRWLVTANEAFMVHSLARAQSKLPGDFVEVGVYQGGTARMICEAKGDKTLHLCDTFEGLPQPTSSDGNVHSRSQYACSLESVQGYLMGHPNVVFHKGLFPDSVASAEEVRGSTYCFAHFDVDLYQSTVDCLEFFYPRMVPGGVILSHDYSILAGVRQAFEEFLADKPEAPIELPTTQCMVIKR